MIKKYEILPPTTKALLAFLLAFFISISHSQLFSQSKKIIDDDFIQCNDRITIVSSGDLDLGNMLKGTTRYFNYDNLIKFKISSNYKVNIKLYKYTSYYPNDGTQFGQTWKMGQNSGFEETFSSSKRISLRNNNDYTYFVTLQINSITVPNSAQSGAHRMDITLVVETDD